MAYGAVDPGYVRAPGGAGGRVPMPTGGYAPARPVVSPLGRVGLTNMPNGATPAGTINALGRTAPALQGARGNPALQAAIDAKRTAPVTPGGSVIQRLQALNPAQATAFHAWIDHATGAAPGTSAGAGGGAAGGGGAPALMLPGVTEAGFQGARDRANENYLDAIRSNRLQYGLTNNSYTSRLRDMATQNAEAWRTEPDQFVARGIFDSGIHNRNMDTLTTAQLRAHSDLMSQRAGQLATIMDARNGIERSRADAIANIEAQRQTAAARMAVGSVR